MIRNFWTHTLCTKLHSGSNAFLAMLQAAAQLPGVYQREGQVAVQTEQALDESKQTGE